MVNAGMITWQSQLVQTLPRVIKPLVSAYTAKKQAEIKLAEIRSRFQIESGKLKVVALGIRIKAEYDLKRLKEEARNAERYYELCNRQLDSLRLTQENLLQAADRVQTLAHKKGIPAEAFQYYMGFFFEIHRQIAENAEKIGQIGQHPGGGKP